MDKSFSIRQKTTKIIGATLILCGIALALTSIPSRSDAVPRVASIEAVEEFNFEDLATMTVTSDAVIEATVTETRPGRTITEPNGSYLQFREAVLQIDAVRFVHAETRAVVESWDKIVLEEPGWDTGTPMMINGVSPVNEGERGFFFLTIKKSGTPTGEGTSPVYFEYVSSQGRYLDFGGTLRGANLEDPLVQQVQTMSPQALREEIERIRQRFERGELARDPGLPECPPPHCPDKGPRFEMDGDVTVDGNLIVVFECVAYSYSGIAEGEVRTPLETRVDECRLEDRTMGVSESASPSAQPGNTAVSYEATGTGGSRFEASNDVWLCWLGTATFDNGDQLEVSDCQEV